MSGEEIQAMFGDTKATEIEKQLAELNVELKALQAKLADTDDMDERETLEGQAETLREKIRETDASLRDLKRKFSAGAKSK